MRQLPYFECHITVEGHKDNAPWMQLILKDTAWKFSMIDGDPVLGDGVKMYATANFPVSVGIKECIYNMDRMAVSIGTVKASTGFNMFKILRTKVETVVYDKVWE